MTDGAELHRYLYTVIRIVPNPAVGEFINYAVLVLDPESGIAYVQKAANDRHALRLAQQRDIDAMNQHLGNLFKDRPRLTESDLQRLRADHRNVVQYSKILPVLGTDLQAAVNTVFKHVIVEND